MPTDRFSSAFPSYCRRTIKAQLPGVRAQQKMAPAPDHRPDLDNLDGMNTRASAVLILFSLEDPHSILYTVRNEQLLHHGGQISFPGGRQEPDETPRETACRETAEEVGVHPHQYEITGCLSPIFVPPSQFIIHPWIAFCGERPAVSIQTTEVSEAFWVTMDDLLDQEKIKTRKLSYRQKTLTYPYWDVHRVPLWGATAMITSEIVTLYHDFLKEVSGPENH